MSFVFKDKNLFLKLNEETKLKLIFNCKLYRTLWIFPFPLFHCYLHLDKFYQSFETSSNNRVKNKLAISDNSSWLMTMTSWLILFPRQSYHRHSQEELGISIIEILWTHLQILLRRILMISGNSFKGLFVQSFQLNVLFQINPLTDGNRSSCVNLWKFFVQVAPEVKWVRLMLTDYWRIADSRY